MTALLKEITINDVKYIREDAITREDIAVVNHTTMGSTSSAKLPFEVYLHDLPKTMTYVNAEKAVAALGEGWRIPTLEELHLMYKHKDEIGGFCTKNSLGSDYPGWYWSSTECRDDSSHVHGVRFSDGGESWDLKDSFG